MLELSVDLFLGRDEMRVVCELRVGLDTATMFCYQSRHSFCGGLEEVTHLEGN